MGQTWSYNLKHANGTVELALLDDRLVVKTQGTGLIDRLRTTDVRLADLEAFAVVPIIGAQAVVGRSGAQLLMDGSFDAEFVFSYQSGGKRIAKRVFVSRQDPSLRGIVDELLRRRPDASLLHLDPAAALKQVGVTSARTALIVLLIVVLALPIVITAIALLAGS